jgi:hypothetical protein
VEFFKGATGKSCEFKIVQMEGGRFKLSFTSPPKNTFPFPMGKKYVAGLNPDGTLGVEYKFSPTPAGGRKFTLIHGDEDWM